MGHVSFAARFLGALVAIAHTSCTADNAEAGLGIFPPAPLLNHDCWCVRQRCLFRVLH